MMRRRVWDFTTFIKEVFIMDFSKMIKGKALDLFMTIMKLYFILVTGRIICIMGEEKSNLSLVVNIMVILLRV